ncbi:MAG: ATPase [Alphaproteobacteria bacterium CG11_big_fil_rev_8_21_14_0_20_44_7]|nr:MAG: ATPase [Alphaproteobacteria bacterium CG11_big_fil_rev_8_21_14_0_20_44_7]
MANEVHVIVVGNEKGGTGKTTSSMHIVMGLLKLGFSVGSIDIDSRQQSLSNFFTNREYTEGEEHYGLEMPEHYFIPRALGKETVEDIERDEHDRFMRKLRHLEETKDFVLIDTPGSNTYLARLAHSYSDTIITPINDSFIDFDLLAKLDRSGNVLRPSLYSEMVWNQRMVRAQRDGESRATDWLVLCNRLSHLDAKNKRRIFGALEKLSDRIGFRVVSGFTERVIYREMYQKGLTVLDILDHDLGVRPTLSHIAARAEVWDLLKSLRLDNVNERIKNFESRAQESKESANSQDKDEENSYKNNDELQAAI